MLSVSELLKKFPPEYEQPTLLLGYILFVCKHLQISLTLEYDNGKYYQLGPDGSRTELQDESGYRILVGMKGFVDGEGKDLIYPDVGSLVVGGLRLLKEKMEEMDKQ